MVLQRQSGTLHISTYMTVSSAIITSAIASLEPRRLPARLKALRAACFP